MERSRKKGRRAIERVVKGVFPSEGQFVLPILSLETEARAQMEDVLEEVNRAILQNLLLASAEELARAKMPGRASGACVGAAAALEQLRHQRASPTKRCSWTYHFTHTRAKPCRVLMSRGFRRIVTCISRVNAGY